MKQFTVNELNDRISKAQKVIVTFNDGINLKTRCGSYITLRTGLITDTFFVGKDLEADKDIIELL